MEIDTRPSNRRVFVGGALALGMCALGRVLTGSTAPNGSSAPDGRIPSPTATSPSSRTQARPRPSNSAPGGAAGSLRRGSTSVTYTLPADRREIALTFDDGPDADFTPQILEVLRRHSVPATFCVIGENAAEHPDLLRAVTDAGHHLANHTWNHAQLTRLPPARAREELARTSDLIARTVGAPPAMARAPYGDWSPDTLRTCAELGMSPLGWSVDTEDWNRPGVTRIAGTVLDDVRPGAVILQHDGGGNRSQSVAALADYLPRLLDAGYRPVLPGT